MRIFENIIFFVTHFILLIYLLLMNIKLFRNVKDSKYIGIAQLILVDFFSIFTLYQIYLWLQTNGIMPIDLKSSWNQLIIAIMAVSALGYSIVFSKSAANQIIAREKDNLAATVASNAFTLIVLLATVFSLEWNVKWIF